MSKGTRPRPFSVTQQEYNSRWDAIFSRDGLDERPTKPRWTPPPLPAELQTPSSFEQQLGVSKLPPGRT
jgi:hypothetical protein